MNSWVLSYNFCECFFWTHLMVWETVGLKSGGSSVLHLGQERLCGWMQRWRHGKQTTCWQGRMDGSVNSSRQTGQEMPNLYGTKYHERSITALWEKKNNIKSCWILHWIVKSFSYCEIFLLVSNVLFKINCVAVVETANGNKSRWSFKLKYRIQIKDGSSWPQIPGDTLVVKRIEDPDQLLQCVHAPYIRRLRHQLSDNEEKKPQNMSCFSPHSSPKHFIFVFNVKGWVHYLLFFEWNVNILKLFPMWPDVGFWWWCSSI